ncbi:MAG: hypothetical protein QOC68_384 [Solirubrobacteraceae bacterium]|jgi:hypothetical protein|nr:hypothetical protein [Solirubrobacteraceae bacterium]
MPRFLLLFAVAAALSLVAAGAAQARTCSAPKYPGSGYFTSLSVKNVSCKTGRKVTLAHYRCRTAHSRAGRCHKSVLGYSCSERRQSISTEIDGRVTCKRGSRRVTYTYQQNI